MRMAQQEARLYGVESSKGEFQGTKFDSTKFHLSVDLGEKSSGQTLGVVSRPFKLGDSTEIDKWLRYKDHLAQGGGLPVLVEFDVVAAADGVKLSLLTIVPKPAQKQAA